MADAEGMGMTIEHRIDHEILNIDTEAVCCPDFRKGITKLSEIIERDMNVYGETKLPDIPKFRLCPWCGTGL